MRAAMLVFFSPVLLMGSAGAQSVGVDPYSLRPSLHIPLSGSSDRAETYKRLPYRDLGNEIRIELPADTLFDFELGVVRSTTAGEYFQQVANLIFEEARGQVRIECQSGGDPAAAQKLGERCASAVAHWLIAEEKLTKVKFTTLGKRAGAPAAPPPAGSPVQARSPRAVVTISFAKK